jgi:hypothetical protein
MRDGQGLLSYNIAVKQEQCQEEVTLSPGAKVCRRDKVFAKMRIWKEKIVQKREQHFSRFRLDSQAYDGLVL